MAGVQKEFELLFKLSASLGPNFNSSFKSALNTQKALQDSVKKVNSIQGKIDGYSKSSKAITEQSEKLEKLKSEHEKINESIKRHQQNADKLRAKIEETGDASGELTAQLVKEENEVQKDTEKLARNESQIQQTTAKIEQHTQKLNELGQELEDAGVSTENLEERNAELKKSYENLRQSQERLGQINQKQQELNQSISDTKGKLLATTGAIGAVAAAFYAGPIKGAMDYETAMKKVSTIADTQAVPLNKLSSQITALSNETGIAATNIADDVYNAISAGQKTGDAVNFVSNSTKLAKAGFAESSQTLDVLTTILNAYGMEASKVGNVSDMLIQTQNKGKVTVGELSSVMGKIIPTANANGVALEQLCAGYAIMTSKGIAAAETTTYMNSMLNEMGKTGTTADKTLRKVAGGSFKELMASGKSVGDVLAILDEAAKKDGKSLSDMFGSAEAGKAAMSLLSNGAKGFNQQVAGMVDSAGATQEAFEKMEQSTSAKMEKAKNAVSNLGITLGQQLLPTVGQVAEKVADLVNKVTDYAQENPKAVQTVLKLVAGLAALKVGGLGVKLGFLEGKKGILALQKGFTQLNILRESKKLGTLATNFGGVFKVLGPIAAIVAAVGGAIYYVSQNLEDVRKKIQKTFGDEGLAVFDQIWGVITQIGDAFKTAFSSAGTDVFSTLKEIIPPVVNELQKAATTILPVLVQMVQQLAPVFAQLASTLLPALAQIAGTIVTVLAKFISAILPVLVNLINQLIPVIAQIITAILPILVQLINELVPIFMEIVQMILPVIIQLLNTLIPVIMQIIEAVLPVLTSLINALLPIIQMIASSILPAIVQVLNVLIPLFQNIIDAIMPALMAIINAAVPVIQFLADVLGSALGGALQSITSVVQSVMTVFQGLIDFITGVFTGNWSQAWEGVKSIFSGIFSSFVGLCKVPINGVIGIINGAIDGINKINVDIPDWVPGVGGDSLGFNIPKIPLLAKGSNSTPETFIAGEEGPELITNAPKRSVYTAAETENIFAAQKAVAAAGKTPEVKTAPEVKASGGGGGSKSVVINQTNNITINGDKPEQLEETLQQNNEKLLQQVDEKLNGDEDERRTRYE